MLREQPKYFYNRIEAVMEHTARFAFEGRVRLAEDAGVSKSAVSRLLNGKTRPSAAVLLAVTAALEKQVGKRLDPRELVSLDGTYPTLSVCTLVGCKGCLPDEAYDENDVLKPEYRDVRPGEWSQQERKGEAQ